MKTRYLNAAAIFFAILGTVLLSCLDNAHWGAGCFMAALFCVSLATGRVP